MQQAICFSVLPMDDYLATTSLSLVWMLAGGKQRHELADALFGLEIFHQISIYLLLVAFEVKLS